MKVFVSWSGELSREIAELLKKWIPCFIQSVEVFFSPEDIEKGTNWEKTISEQLAECNYGIVCLTSENTMAPWINFEAGAIAKSLDSRVSALMVNIKPSDIKGPLSRYQGTKFEKEDFFSLISSINKSIEHPLDPKILKNTFDAMWGALENEAVDAINRFTSKKPHSAKIEEKNSNSPLEEILQILRTQNSILSNPETLVPIEYMEYALRKISEKHEFVNDEGRFLLRDLTLFLDDLISEITSSPYTTEFAQRLESIHFNQLFDIILFYMNKMQDRKGYRDVIRIKHKYDAFFQGKIRKPRVADPIKEAL